VIFLDDFTQDELGEFPARWDLKEGTFEIAEMDGERWLRCVSSSGTVRMKVPPTLPEFWTLEFDFYGVDLGGSIALTMTALTSDGNQVWEMLFPYSGSSVGLRCGSIGSTTPLGSAIEGRHHVMFLARGNGLKVYLDRERVGNIPDVSRPGFGEINFSLAAPSKPMIANAACEDAGGEGHAAEELVTMDPLRYSSTSSCPSQHPSCARSRPIRSQAR
jgi:hypothetical protein